MRALESLIAKFALAVASILVVLVVIEAAAIHYLWNIATEEEFQTLASINQIKARYGDDFFVLDEADSAFNARRLSPHHFLGFYPTPNLQRETERHNVLGFRGDPVAIEKPADAYRIVALGGSTTYSTGVDDYRHAYPYQLQGYLRAQGWEDAEVVNAGVSGYASFHTVMNLQFRVLPLKPDLIVIYQGLNDIDTRLVYPYEEYLGDNSGYIAPFVTDTIMPAISEYSSALRILGIMTGVTRSHTDINWQRHRPATSNYRDLFLRQWIRDIYPSEIFLEAPVMEILRNNPPIHFERNLRSMLAIARAHDVAVLLVTLVTNAEIRHPINSSDEYVFALAQHNDITRRIAGETGTALLDLQAEFPDDPALFTDGRHMTLDGNRLRAQLIGDFIISAFPRQPVRQ